MTEHWSSEQSKMPRADGEQPAQLKDEWQRPQMYRAVIELNAPSGMLDNNADVQRLVEDIVDEFDFTLIQYESVEFEPIGITGFGVIGESHISIHTWPEYQYAHVELLTCTPLPDADELRARFPIPQTMLAEVRRCEP